jgi:hypothetical protein
MPDGGLLRMVQLVRGNQKDTLRIGAHGKPRRCRYYTWGISWLGGFFKFRRMSSSSTAGMKARIQTGALLAVG